jgi:hypothetical protein
VVRARTCRQSPGHRLHAAPARMSVDPHEAREADRRGGAIQRRVVRWEAQFLHDGELAYGRRYLVKQDALEEADAQQARALK